MRRVLLIQTAFIGDVVLSTPMIRAFHKHFPEDELSVLVKPEAAAILKGNPNIKEVIVFDKRGRHRGLRGMAQITKEIKSKKFDILLSPHQSHRTSLLALRSGIPLRIGYASAGLSRLAYHKRLKRDLSKPEIRRLLSFLDEALGTNSSPMPDDLEIFATKAAGDEAASILREFDAQKPILMAPSSVWPTKRWTPSGFADLCQILVNKYKKKILLVGSAADSAIAKDILLLLKTLYPDSVQRKVINICGKTSLLGLYALMERSALLVSNDSAPVHFGCAAKIPVVAIFGPTTPSLGYAPIAKRSIVAQIEGLACRPCGTHGGKRCPKRHFRCMKDLSAKQVFSAIEQVYGPTRDL